MCYSNYMLKTNWHTHTVRCRHAIGSDEEYVLAAIKAGMKTLGFSDHAPYIGNEKNQRMQFEELEDYRSSIMRLKEKYKDQIDIYCGMEVEYYPEHWEELSYYRNHLDYCILGQHSVSYDGVSVYTLQTPEELKEYVDAIEQACKHGLCDYIAHPDVVMWSYAEFDEAVMEAIERIADISLKYDVPVELNCGSGVKYPMQEYPDGKRYAYPTRPFFEKFAEKGCKVIIGLDIHDPSLFLTDDLLNRALSVVVGLDLNILYDFDLPAAAVERRMKFYCFTLRRVISSFLLGNKKSPKVTV